MRDARIEPELRIVDRVLAGPQRRVEERMDDRQQDEEGEDRDAGQDLRMCEDREPSAPQGRRGDDEGLGDGSHARPWR
jgi:hypothetical protein